MKKIFLFLLFISTNIVSMEMQRAQQINQAKEDAVVIRALCNKHNIVLTNDTFDANISAILCKSQESFMPLFGEKLAHELMLSAIKQENILMWKIHQFKKLLLNYFQESKQLLKHEIQVIKQSLPEIFN